MDKVKEVLLKIVNDPKVRAAFWALAGAVGAVLMGALGN